MPAHRAAIPEARRLGYPERASVAHAGRAKRSPRGDASLKHGLCRLFSLTRGCSPLAKPDGTAVISKPPAEEPGASLSQASPGYIARASPCHFQFRPFVLFRVVNIWHRCRRESTPFIAKPAKMRARRRPWQPHSGRSKPGSGSRCRASH